MFRAIKLKLRPLFERLVTEGNQKGNFLRGKELKEKERALMGLLSLRLCFIYRGEQLFVKCEEFFTFLSGMRIAHPPHPLSFRRIIVVNCTQMTLNNRSFILIYSLPPFTSLNYYMG